MKTYTGAEITIKMLEKSGIKTIAGIPGGTNLPLYDAVKKSSIKHILVRHEQSAGFIAQGMARASGQPAFCFATSGPGATNLITAIADAKADSIPIIAITGQVSSALQGTDAFQEINIIDMCRTITKKTFVPKQAKDLLKIIPEAFNIAKQGRPGPVLIDIPKDIQLERIQVKCFPEIKPVDSLPISFSDTVFKKAADLINNATKPVFFIGGGMQNEKAIDALSSFCNKNKIPITCSLMGLGTWEADSNLFLGMAGMHGSIRANFALNKADLVIALGVRFGDRSTGKTNLFCPNAKVIHVDIDKNELNKIIKADVSVNCNASMFLTMIFPFIKETNHDAWRQNLRSLKDNVFAGTQKRVYNIINSLPDDCIITTDVGQHQMWAAQTFNLKGPRRFLTSGGLGTMGFGLPAAIGAALHFPEKTIVCFSGDGSILMNIQEFATLRDLDLNVKVIILNNSSLGLVRQQQTLFYNAKLFASEYQSGHDFVEIAKAFGLNGFRINDFNDALPFIYSKGARILEMIIDRNDNVFPIVTPGKSNVDQICQDTLQCARTIRD